MTYHYDVVGLKAAHVAIPRHSYLYIHSATITQSEGRLEGGKAEERMFKTLDEGRRQEEWEAWHVITKVNPNPLLAADLRIRVEMKAEGGRQRLWSDTE